MNNNFLYIHVYYSFHIYYLIYFNIKNIYFIDIRKIEEVGKREK
jgi:hypothetical protein